MNLPRGKLIDTLKGGPDVLRRLLAGLGGRDFNGYIKVDHQREDTEAHGILILMGSRPVMAIYIWKQRLFGQSSLRPILRDTLDEDCTIKVFGLPDEARTEMMTAVSKFSTARIEMDRFDLERETRLFLGDGSGTAPGGPAPGVSDAGPEAAPAAGARPEESAALLSSISQLGVDTTDLRRKEEELLRREYQLKHDLEQGRRERDRLRTEGENFLHMDQALHEQIKLREGETNDREQELTRRITELQRQLDRRAEDMATREADIKKELDKLAAEREELQRREEKLLEMEKMFRRVLTNTEERLRQKEDELVRKEEELEKVLRERMRDAGAPHAPTAAQAPAELQKLDEALRARDGALQKRESDLEERIARFQSEVAEHESRKAAAASGPAPADGTVTAGPGSAELRTLLRSLDALFDSLPPEAVDRFAASAEFRLYESIMVKLGLAKK